MLEEELVVPGPREGAEALHRDDHLPVARFVLLAELDEPSRARRIRGPFQRLLTRRGEVVVTESEDVAAKEGDERDRSGEGEGGARAAAW